jgi:uncharacterized protein
VKWILLGLGWISFILGIIGAVLPVLPTAPFLILSAFLFSKSSPRFHQWILDLPFAGPVIIDWRDNRVINLKAKVVCALTLTGSGVIIWLSSTIPFLVQIFVTCILVGVGVFVLTRQGR